MDHWGQRKLFLSELYFLTKYSKLGKVVIYAGNLSLAYITISYNSIDN